MARRPKRGERVGMVTIRRRIVRGKPGDFYAYWPEKPSGASLKTKDRWLAKQAAMAISRRILGVDQGRADEVPGAPLTIAALFEAYADAKRAQNRAPGTILSIEVIGRRVARILGDRTLVSEVGARELANLQRDLAHLKPGTRNETVDKLRAALSWARQMGYIQGVPSSPGRVQLPQERVRTWTAAETQAIFAELACDQDLITEAVCRLALLAGLRASEAVMARRDLADLNRGVLRIRPDEEQGYRLKSRRGHRDVPLGQSLRDFLASLPAAGGAYWAPIKAQSYRHRIQELRAAGARFIRLRRRLRVGRRGHCFHAFRHTFALEMLRSGADVATVAAAIGDSVMTVVRSYAHTTPDHVRRVVLGLDFDAYTAHPDGSIVPFPCESGS